MSREEISVLVRLFDIARVFYETTINIVLILKTNMLFRSSDGARWYRVFSRDVTAAMLLSLHKGMAAMLVSAINPPGIEFYSYANIFISFGWKTCSLIAWVKTLYAAYNAGLPWELQFVQLPASWVPQVTQLAVVKFKKGIGLSSTLEVATNGKEIFYFSSMRCLLPQGKPKIC